MSKKIIRLFVGLIGGGIVGLFGLWLPIRIFHSDVIQRLIEGRFHFHGAWYPIMMFVVAILSTMAGVAYALVEPQLPKRSIFRACVSMALASTIGFIGSLLLLWVLQKFHFFVCDLCGEAHDTRAQLQSMVPFSFILASIFFYGHWFRKR